MRSRARSRRGVHDLVRVRHVGAGPTARGVCGCPGRGGRWFCRVGYAPGRAPASGGGSHLTFAGGVAVAIGAIVPCSEGEIGTLAHKGADDGREGVRAEGYPPAWSMGLSEQPPVIIRHSARHDLVMRAEVSIAPGQRALLKFASAAGARDGWLDADVLDVSSGGLGLVIRLFIPRRALARVRLFIDEAGKERVIECQVRVQRVIMTDRRPAYLLGTSFEGLTAAEIEGLDQLIERLNAD